MEATIMVNLEVALGKQGDFYIAYAPALELSAYGSTEEEALKGFEQVLDIFFEETSESNNLTDILLDLGWKLQRKPVAKYTPPVFNRYFIKNLPEAPKYIKTERQPVAIPV